MSNSWTSSATSAPSSEFLKTPLRSLRAMTDEALRELQPTVNKLYTPKPE